MQLDTSLHSRDAVEQENDEGIAACLFKTWRMGVVVHFS